MKKGHVYLLAYYLIGIIGAILIWTWLDKY
jgi:hypothetical protein